MPGEDSGDKQKEYIVPRTVYFGRVESITEGLICSATAYKQYDASEDDVTPYGFLGSPFCFEMTDTLE